MTLVEILVAVSILSVAVIVLASLFPVALNCQKRATYTQIASLDAQGALDEAMVVGFNSLVVGTTVSTVADLPAGNARTVTISPYPTSDSTCLRLVTIRTTWPGGKGAKYTAGEVLFRTLIAKPFKEGNLIDADI